MPIVTLITDWGFGDYIGRLKGLLLNTVPNVSIIDISHQVSHFNTLQAAYLLRQSFHVFPEGTIHLIGVNSEPSPYNPLVLVKAHKHFFIGPNDGMFNYVIEGQPESVIELFPANIYNGFQALPMFAMTVKTIIEGTPLDELGKPGELRKEIRTHANYDESVISGRVIHIDDYGNLITNISKELFEKVAKGRPFTIFVQSNHVRINNLSTYYDEVSPGNLVAMFNSANMLEIAMFQGNIAAIENLDTKSSVRIKFHD